MIRTLFRLASALLTLKILSSGSPRRSGTHMVRRQAYKAGGRKLRRWIK